MERLVRFILSLRGALCVGTKRWWPWQSLGIWRSGNENGMVQRVIKRAPKKLKQWKTTDDFVSTHTAESEHKLICDFKCNHCEYYRSKTSSRRFLLNCWHINGKLSKLWLSEQNQPSNVSRQNHLWVRTLVYKQPWSLLTAETDENVEDDQQKRVSDLIHRGCKNMWRVNLLVVCQLHVSLFITRPPVCRTKEVKTSSVQLCLVR